MNDSHIYNLTIILIGNTKLPCHVVGQKIMFHHGSSNAVFIHHTTRDSTIKVTYLIISISGRIFLD